MSQYNYFHKLYECFEDKAESVSKPDRGTQTAPSTLIEKDASGSNLSSSEGIITLIAISKIWHHYTKS
jgi:hypothetical protein